MHKFVYLLILFVAVSDFEVLKQMTNVSLCVRVIREVRNNTYNTFLNDLLSVHVYCIIDYYNWSHVILQNIGAN